MQPEPLHNAAVDTVARRAAAQASVGQAILDAHVHLHMGQSLEAYLAHAAVNVRRIAAAEDLPPDTPAGLLLAECAGVDRFDELARRAGDALGPWRVEPTNESCALRLRAAGQPTLVLVAGRQIVTRQRLEVLALGTRTMFDDRNDIAATIAQVHRDGALPVLPWGFGKWLFGRGRIVRDLIDSPPVPTLCLGDNGGRPCGSMTPTLLKRAGRPGRPRIPVLPGSDPLPFAHQVGRIGRYGFTIAVDLAGPRPFDALREALTAGVAPLPVGRRDGWCAFARAQLAMRLHNRGARLNRE